VIIVFWRKAADFSGGVRKESNGFVVLKMAGKELAF
jgi:hypothetical protein